MKKKKKLYNYWCGLDGLPLSSYAYETGASSKII